MTAPFIGLADLSDALGEDVSTSDLAVIALDAACQVVRDEIANVVNLTEDEEITMDGTGRYRLIMPQPPVREVSEVLVSDVEIATTDYVLEGRNAIAGVFLRRISGVWPIGLGNIAITYTHGWDVSEPLSSPPVGFERVPSSLRQVALSLATRVYNNYTSGGTAGAVTSERIGSYAYTVDTETAIASSSAQLLDAERVTLNRYKAYVFV